MPKTPKNIKPGKKNQDLTFYMKNVRCFGGRQDFTLRPLTFLVGENSTGKTTLLGCFDAMTRMMYEPHPDFNKPPYNMGSFKNIIKKGSHKEFHIGFSLKQPHLSLSVCFTEDKKQSGPLVKNIHIEHQDNKWDCDYEKNNITYQTGSKTKKSMSISDHFPKNFLFIPIEILFSVLFKSLLLQSLSPSKIKTNNKKTQKYISAAWDRSVGSLLSDLRKHLGWAVSLAPVRSKPQRTYDPIKEMPDPEGGNVPMQLMRLKTTDDKKWQELRKNLVSFGKTSGLFTDIEVKKYVESMSEPFQLQFKVRGMQSNIRDVGYGVSQILPLLKQFFSDQHSTRFFLHKYATRFLLQQPEVHLHPRAQAELASLLVKSVKDYKHAFLIETHSDYMVDRVCIEIQKGNISPDLVSLIYLEAKKNGDVQAHNLCFDSEGNLSKPPPGYRKFFIKEMDQMMGFDT